MGYRVDFADNQTITAEMLNEVSEVLNSSASEFEDDVLYGIDSLNGILSSVITKGVSTGCNVSCSGNTVNISSGMAFFNDGRRIIVDSNGITLERISGETNYVRFHHNTETGFVSAVCDTDEPSGDYVLLAEISPSGTVGGVRDIALMKNASLLPNSYITKNVHISYQAGGPHTGTISIGGNYRRMVLRTSNGNLAYYNWDSGKLYTTDDDKIVEYNISQERYITVGNNVSVSLVSFTNNVITYKANGYGSFFGDFTLDCM